MHVTVYETTFHIYDQPRAIEAIVSIIHDIHGKPLVRTPHACLPWYGPEPTEEALIKFSTAGNRYHATEEEANAELARRFPHWQTTAAQSLMARLRDYMRWHGSLGPDRLAYALDISREELFALARGRKPVPRKLQTQLDTCNG